MTLEDTIRQQVREAVREELRPLAQQLAEVLELAKGAAGFLSVEQAAELAGVHPNTVYGWIKSGALPPRRAGRSWRICRDELRAMMERAKAPEASPERLADEFMRRRRTG